jgi:hypothetical protein
MAPRLRGRAEPRCRRNLISLLHGHALRATNGSDRPREDGQPALAGHRLVVASDRHARPRGVPVEEHRGAHWPTAPSVRSRASGRVACRSDHPAPLGPRRRADRLVRVASAVLGAAVAMTQTVGREWGDLKPANRGAARLVTRNALQRASVPRFSAREASRWEVSAGRVPRSLGRRPGRRPFSWPRGSFGEP